MRFAVMIEGQEDVTWEDWLLLARTCERLGFETLFRSDHYLSVMGGRTRGALDAWATVCGLAAVTSTLRLGTLVSPATFRHPSVLAKLAVSADHISGGRVELGIGDGLERGRAPAYGFPFPSMRTRMDRLAEQVEIVHRSWGDEPFSFQGEHYTVENLDARPKPVQKPHVPLLMGGAAGPRGAALAARWADEYNVVGATPEEAAERRGRLREACERAGRDPDTLRFSVMHPFVVGERGGGPAPPRRRAGDARAARRRGGPERHAGPARRAAPGVRGGGRRARDAPAPAPPRHRGARAARRRGRPGAGVTAFTGARLDRAGDARRRDADWLAAQLRAPRRARRRRRHRGRADRGRAGSPLVPLADAPAPSRSCSASTTPGPLFAVDEDPPRDGRAAARRRGRRAAASRPPRAGGDRRRPAPGRGGRCRRRTAAWSPTPPRC